MGNSIGSTAQSNARDSSPPAPLRCERGAHEPGRPAGSPRTQDLPLSSSCGRRSHDVPHGEDNVIHGPDPHVLGALPRRAAIVAGCKCLRGFRVWGTAIIALRGGAMALAPFLAPMRCVRFCSLAFAVDRRNHIAPLTCNDVPRTTLDGRYFIFFAKVGVAGSNPVVRSSRHAGHGTQ
jgi:hypothetical protein